MSVGHYSRNTTLAIHSHDSRHHFIMADIMDDSGPEEPTSPVSTASDASSAAGAGGPGSLTGSEAVAVSKDGSDASSGGGGSAGDASKGGDAERADALKAKGNEQFSGVSPQAMHHAMLPHHALPHRQKPPPSTYLGDGNQEWENTQQ